MNPTASFQKGWAPASKTAIVLAGNHTECGSYYKRCEPGIMHYNGLGIIAGIHADRLIITGSFFAHPNMHDILQYARVVLKPGCDNEIFIDGYPGWYVKWDAKGDPILHDELGKLRCNLCKKTCYETYAGGFCGECKGTQMKYKASKVTDPFQKPKQTDVVHRNVGDIWKLPKANSPMWTEQWGYQGSSKTPYVISHRTENLNGAMTPEGWACSCPNFTRNTPRVDCKHILNVKLKEGLGVPATKGAAKLANVDAEKLKAFEAWEREQAAAKKEKPTAGDANLKIFGATGRKFR